MYYVISKNLDNDLSWATFVEESSVIDYIREGETDGFKPANSVGEFVQSKDVMLIIREPLEKVSKFERALGDMLWNKEIDFLNVDYRPCRELDQCLKAAGIHDTGNILPWKTSMRFRDGGVQVSCGYGEPYVELLNT